jgi:hypothetical protein
VGVAGNGVGLLNGQTIKRDSMTSEEGEGLFTLNTTGVKDRVSSRHEDLGHVANVFKEMIRGLYDLLRQKPPSL